MNDILEGKFMQTVLSQRLAAVAEFVPQGARYLMLEVTMLTYQLF